MVAEFKSVDASRSAQDSIEYTVPVFLLSFSRHPSEGWDRSQNVNGAGLRVIPAFAGMTWQLDAITL
jgi:hypothetical protein